MVRTSMICAALLVGLTPGRPAAAPEIGEGEVRALAARQSALWNAADMAGYFATFDPAAVFTDQALGSDNRIVPVGRSSVAEAKAQVRKALGRGRITEAVAVRRVFLGPSRRAAAISAEVRTTLQNAGERRESCAYRIVTYGRRGGRLVALSQTDTLVRCR